MPPMWSMIQGLHPSNARSAIKVRVVRSYDMRSKNSDKIWSHELVIHDREGDRIHATIPRSLISKFKPLLKEDHLYAIKNFMVMINDNRYKTTTRMYYIKFINSTHVESIHEENFPRYVFNFKTFKDVATIENVEDSILFDVIGVVKGSNVKTVVCKNGKEKRLIQISLEDEEHEKLLCTLWEEYVDETIKAFETRNEKCDIMIVQMCRPNDFRGGSENQVCNYFNVTKVWFNNDLPEINALRSRIVDTMGCATALSATSVASSSIVAAEVPSLSTIEQINKAQDGMSYWIYGAIIVVECSGGWSYLSCTNCRKKVEKVGSKFYCDKCHKDCGSANMRFKLKVFVIDQTNNAPFSMWDRECVQLIGKTASEFTTRSDEIEDDVVPEEIETALVDKKMLFKVQKKLDMDNKPIYTITKIINDPSIIEACMKDCGANEESDSIGADACDNHTPNKKEKSHDFGELLDDGLVKRSLDDQSSSSVSVNKTKVFIKQEKD